MHAPRLSVQAIGDNFFSSAHLLLGAASLSGCHVLRSPGLGCSWRAARALPQTQPACIAVMRGCHWTLLHCPQPPSAFVATLIDICEEDLGQKGPRRKLRGCMQPLAMLACRLTHGGGLLTLGASA